MKKNNTKKSKFLALLLSLMMVSTASAALASCTDPEDSSSSVSSSVDSSATDASDEVKDTGLIKNSDFETFEKNDGKNVIGTSVTGWSSSLNSASSGTSTSSKAKSGIVDTAEWNYLSGAKYTEDQIKALSDADAIADWDNFTAKDKLAFYEAWEERNPDGKISEDFEKYQKLNIIERDIPNIANPKTHWVEGAEGYEDNKDKTNILMIHNENPDPTSTTSSNKTIGLAQKFTSSSTVTVPAGTAATFSVWVKTANLQTSTTDGTSQKAVNRGAYISITHSVGARSLDAFEVKNIDTDGVTENNGWVQYSFYLKSAAYADTTFSIVLGLGQGGGTDRYEYVNGYAFFDDLRCELISEDKFEEAITATGEKAIDFTATLESDKLAKTIDAYKHKTYKEFALNFFGATAWEQQSANIFNATTVDRTESSVGLDSVNPAKDTTNSVTGVFADRTAIETAAQSNKYLEVIYNNFFDDTNEDGEVFVDTLTDKNILMLLSANGTAYTATSTASFTLDTNNDPLDPTSSEYPEYMALSFYVKTSDLSSGTAASVTLVNGFEETAFSSLNIYDIEGVKIGDTENIYDGWQKCFFFVKLDEDVDSSSFTLKFNYGPTDITTSTTKESFVPGFAAFAGFESYGMSEKEFESAKSGTYAQIVTLKEDTTEAEGGGNSGFDSVKGVPVDALEKGLGTPANYKGVYSDNYRVSLPDGTDDDSRREINNYANAGLLNKKHFAEVLANSDNAGAAWLTGIQALTTETDAGKIWNAVFEGATQPLVIWNDAYMVSGAKSYGFIGTKTTASSGQKAISLRVKTTGAAKASVYLIDAEDGSYQNALSISRSLTFWYDDNGNICTGDPAKKGTQVAFKLQSNGLYKANKNWKGYSALTDEQKNGYFANLNAYGEVGAGDLFVAENGASHDYHDYTWNREAFYLYNGAYYTEDNGNGVKVLNLADLVTAEKLTARYTATANKELKVENISTDGQWVTVTFYLNVGETAKNYRLEVWNSATRKGTPVEGLVAFDYNYREANFDLVEEGKENASEENCFESVFSYFDTDKFVRYDSSLDSEKVGNLYDKKFVPSEHTEGVAYLFYTEKNSADQIIGYNVFADYSLTDKTVTPAEKADDTSADSSSDETTTDGANVWLLASSIAIAAVLLLAVASLAIRYSVKAVRKKKGYQNKK
ncbi:MAG: hypothetical protein IKB20_03020 [Clostridia bacterium]|nr:hypothetical protein [Clostridia bacterium]